MNPELLLSFLAATVLLALMPGPDIIYVMTESISRGSRTGISIAAGLCTGVVAHTTAAAFGLSVILQSSATAFTIIKYFGVLYLLFLAYQASKEKALQLDLQGDHSPPDQRFLPLFQKGILMNILNPKVSLFFIAFLPQFVSKAGFSITVQMIVLGIIFMVVSFLVFSAVALLAGRLSSLVNKPRFWNITKWSKVVILLLLAIGLALSET